MNRSRLFAAAALMLLLVSCTSMQDTSWKDQSWEDFVVGHWKRQYDGYDDPVYVKLSRSGAYTILGNEEEGTNDYYILYTVADSVLVLYQSSISAPEKYYLTNRSETSFDAQRKNVLGEVRYTLKYKRVR